MFKFIKAALLSAVSADHSLDSKPFKMAFINDVHVAGNNEDWQK